MTESGCPDKFIIMVSELHDGMKARILHDGDLSDAFPVFNGVEQGCMLASTLFNLIFTALLSDAFHDFDSGLQIRWIQGRCEDV